MHLLRRAGGFLLRLGLRGDLGGARCGPFAFVGVFGGWGGRIDRELVFGFEPDGGIVSAGAAAALPDFMGAMGDFFVGG